MEFKLLIVVPCFNDSERLGTFLPKLCRELSDTGINLRIRVVDDGSSKKEVFKTCQLVEFHRKEFSVLLPAMLLGINQGKGGAVYAGWDKSSDENWIAFVDADGAVPAEEVARLTRFAFSQVQYDGILASRVLMLGHDIDRTIKRHVIGRIYATLSKILLGIPVYDSQCGFKLFKKSIFEKVRADLKNMRFGFDLELLANFYLMGFPLLEIPIRQWRDIPGAKVRLVRDSIDMFVSLFKLRKALRKKEIWMSSNESN